MLHSMTLNNKIIRFQERALRTVYVDYKSSLYELLDKNGSFTIHQSNVQSFAIEIYKYLRDLSPTILGEFFKGNQTIPYDLRTRNELYERDSKTVIYGTKTMPFLSQKIWALIPKNIKHSSSLPCFKKSIGKWKPKCPCCLCKTFL